MGIDAQTGLDDEIVEHVRTQRGPDADTIPERLAAKERTACFVVGFRQNARQVYFHNPRTRDVESLVTCHDVREDGRLPLDYTIWRGPVLEYLDRGWSLPDWVDPVYRPGE